MFDETEILQANRVFHSYQAEHYEDSHGIDTIEQVLLRWAVDRERVEPTNILDIGAGTCAIAKFLDEDIINTDLSPEMLSQGRGPRFVAESRDLPFENDSFELIVSRSVLHHLPDLEAAFDEMTRVLRPGGQVLLLHEPVDGQSTLQDLIIRAKANVNKILGRRGEEWREHAAEEAGLSNPHTITRLANHGAIDGIKKDALTASFDEDIYVEYDSDGSTLFSFLGTVTPN